MKLVWEDAVSISLRIEEGRQTPLIKELFNIPNIDFDLDFNVLFLYKRAQFEAVCATIAEFYNIRPVSVERSIYLQDALFTVIECHWIGKKFGDIQLADIQHHIIADPPVSVLEFDAILRGSFYGSITLQSTIAVARVQVDEMETTCRSARLIPFHTRSFETVRDIQTADIHVVHNAFNALMVRYEDGALVKDPITMQSILRENAIMFDKVWYDRRSIKVWLNSSGKKIVPHSRRDITDLEYAALFLDVLLCQC